MCLLHPIHSPPPLIFTCRLSLSLSHKATISLTIRSSTFSLSSLPLYTLNPPSHTLQPPHLVSRTFLLRHILRRYHALQILQDKESISVGVQALNHFDRQSLRRTPADHRNQADLKLRHLIFLFLRLIITRGVSIENVEDRNHQSDVGMPSIILS